MPLEVWIIFMALVVVAVVVLPRILPPTGPTCTRCEGSGQRQRALARPVQARRLARAEREMPEVRREGAAASADGLTPGRRSRVTLIGEPRRPLRRPSPTVDVCVTPGMVARKTPHPRIQSGAGSALSPRRGIKAKTPGRGRPRPEDPHPNPLPQGEGADADLLIPTLSQRRDLCVTRGRLPGRPLTLPSPPGEGLRGGCADQPGRADGWH